VTNFYHPIRRNAERLGFCSALDPNQLIFINYNGVKNQGYLKTISCCDFRGFLAFIMKKNFVECDELLPPCMTNLFQKMKKRTHLHECFHEDLSFFLSLCDSKPIFQKIVPKKVIFPCLTLTWRSLIAANSVKFINSVEGYSVRGQQVPVRETILNFFCQESPSFVCASKKYIIRMCEKWFSREILKHFLAFLII